MVSKELVFESNWGCCGLLLCGDEERMRFEAVSGSEKLVVILQR